MPQLLLFDAPTQTPRPPDLPSSPSRPHSAPAASRPAAASARAQSAAGVCRFCGCHSDFCLDRAGERCSWTDPSETCCSAEPCRAKLALQKPPSPQRPKPVASHKPARPRRSHTYAAALHRWLTK